MGRQGLSLAGLSLAGLSLPGLSLPDEVAWHDLPGGRAATLAGRTVRMAGWLSPPDLGGRRVLVAEAPCCAACLPGSADARVVVSAATPLSGGPVRLEGELRGPAGGWKLLGARALGGGFNRRRLLAAGPLLCLAAAAPETDPRAVTAGAATVDMHSHAGRLNRVSANAPFTPLAGPMRDGGMAVSCLAIVSDAPTHRVMADHRIHPFRDPAPGELYAYSAQAFGRLHDLVRAQSLTVVTNAAGLHAARGDRPSVIVAAEGGDFLDGDPDRVDEAYQRWQLRHLQLTHYRVNELGDIQTETAVHGGLTDAGAAVIRRCNARGVVVDVAHGTLELVRRAAAVTSKPLVLSHTAVTPRPRPFSRLISPDHAMLVAGTGGVIGIWPSVSQFPDLSALALGMAYAVSIVGIEHVGLGTDMMGLVGPSCFDSYAQLPDLTAALLGAGFSQADVAKLLGGNYARVFTASMS